MYAINEQLKNTSLVKVAAVLLMAFLAVIFVEVIFDFDSNYIVEIVEVIFIGYFIYRFRHCGASFKHDCKNIFSSIPFRYVLLIVILNIFFSYGMIYLYYAFIDYVPDLSFLYSVIVSTKNIGIAGSLISTVILAPIAEELLFRGIIFNKLNRYFSISFAIIVSSILFGISHEAGGIFSAFVFGICMAILYIKSSNILVPIFAHFTNNLLSEVIYYLDFDGLIFSDGIVIIAISVLAIVSAYLLFSSIIQEWRKLT